MSDSESKGEPGVPTGLDPFASPEPEQRPRERPARLAGRYALNGILLLGVSFACAFLLSPGGAERIPYDQDSLGEFASTTVKADRDFDLVNLEKTEHERSAASDAVLPVYDFDPSVVEDGLERIRGAFGTMQEAATHL